MTEAQALLILGAIWATTFGVFFLIGFFLIGRALRRFDP
jgi:hypothetical protein